MAYALKEIYFTLQGEGAHTGRAAVFTRFAGCNLWTGREQDRPDATCRFCDTDFVGLDGPGGGRFADAEGLADAIESQWPNSTRGKRYTVLTGGEPGLQVDPALIDALHRRDFEVGIETNGTVPLPPGIDWICVSPKAGSELVTVIGHELKLVYPQTTALPERFADLEFRHFFLQPMDSPTQRENTEAAIAYCLANPQWRLSLQTHKLTGIK